MRLKLAAQDLGRVFSMISTVSCSITSERRHIESTNVGSREVDFNQVQGSFCEICFEFSVYHG